MTDLNRDFFVTTRWTMVLRAALSDTTRAHAALEDLCQAYWYPLYAYARRRGYDRRRRSLKTSFYPRHQRLKGYMVRIRLDRSRLALQFIGGEENST